MTRRLVVEADGGSRGNPGPAGYGALVRDSRTGEVLAEVAESIGRATNNVAEYRGLLAGLRAAARVDPSAVVEVRMDSRLVIEQMNGRWRIRHPDLIPLALRAREAAGRLRSVTYTWVPRDRNSAADRLANEAIDAAQQGRPWRREQPSSTNEPTPSSGSSDARRQGGWTARPTTTLLLRHAESELSAERRFAGLTDVGLTDLGLSQARMAARRCAERGGIDVVVTSPSRRARRTAEEVVATLGVSLHMEDGLREADFGSWEGLTFAEVSEKWPDELAAWLADPAVAPPGGESLTVVARRVRKATDRLLARFPHRTILVITHVTPIKTLVCQALLAPPAAVHRMQVDVASLSQIDWFDDGPAVVRSLNDTAHLR